MRKIVIVAGPLTDAKTHLINIIPNIGTHTHMRIIEDLPNLNNKSVIVLGDSEEEIKSLNLDQIAEVIAPKEIKSKIPNIKFDKCVEFIIDSFMEREKIKARLMKKYIDYCKSCIIKANNTQA